VSKLVSFVRFIICFLLSEAVLSQAQAKATEVDEAFLLAQRQAYSGLAWQQSAALSDHPLYPYLNYLKLQRAPASTDVAEAKKWLSTYQDELPVAPMLRRKLLAHYAATQRHSDFVSLFRESESNAQERCQVWNARMALAPESKFASEHALKLYQDPSTSFAACKPAFDFLRAQKALTPAEAETRFNALLNLQQVSAAQAVLIDLAPEQQTAAQLRLAAEGDAYTFVKKAGALDWQEPGVLDALTRALERVAAHSPNAADKYLTSLQKLKPLPESSIFKIRSVMTRVAIIANSAQAGAWLDALPAIHRDDQTHEWGVRRALTAMDASLALARVQAMPEILATQPRWLYARARLMEWLKMDAREIGKIYQQASLSPTFYGFLSADRLSSGYTICPANVRFTPKSSSKLYNSSALERISAFRRVNDAVGAKREWMFLVNRLDPTERRQAGLLASMENWGEYAILALNGPDDRTLYNARFPLLEQDILHQHARKNSLDPAFVAGLIRQESAWNPEAVSRANAIGLMQLLPSTAALTAPRAGISAKGINLKHVPTNIALGTAHLSELFEKYSGSPLRMTAAYNAGPRALAKWENQLYQQFPDLWIETVPYKETREYITTVLAFSVIYDWRLDGKLTRLSARVPEFEQVAAPVERVCNP
jgi:soluble lytic murein transglycosylase